MGQVTKILTRGASILPEDEIYEKYDHDEEEYTGDTQYALSDCLGDNRSDVLSDNLSEPEPTSESKMASMRKTMEEPRELLSNAIQ